jgi:hypothetical protein
MSTSSKETIPAKQIEEEVGDMLKRESVPDSMLVEVVNLWLEKKYGLPFFWELKG